jgi:predicted cupin superfamily sugar epimerase
MVAPGFVFADFELADVGDLVTKFPQHRNTIEKFT